MNTKTILGATVAALTLSLATTTLASAQQSNDGGKPRGGKAITIDRLLDGAERMFNMVDADGDGVVSASEAAVMQEKLGQHGDKAQKAKDKMAAGKERHGFGGRGGRKGGKPILKIFIGEEGLTTGMTWDAVQAKVSATFNEFDTDASGSLSRDEMMPVMQELRGTFGPRSNG